MRPGRLLCAVRCDTKPGVGPTETRNPDFYFSAFGTFACSLDRGQATGLLIHRCGSRGINLIGLAGGGRDGLLCEQ
jgi:hypothetical protein